MIEGKENCYARGYKLGRAKKPFSGLYSHEWSAWLGWQDAKNGRVYRAAYKQEWARKPKTVDPVWFCPQCLETAANEFNVHLKPKCGCGIPWQKRPTGYTSTAISTERLEARRHRAMRQLTKKIVSDPDWKPPVITIPDWLCEEPCPENTIACAKCTASRMNNS